MAILILFLGLLMRSLSAADAQSIGVCYGRDGNNLPPPAEVVALYRQRNIGRMRIYDPNQQVLDALRGSNIELILGVPNDNLQSLGDAAAATRWVQSNVRNFWPAVRIRYIAVGNEVPANDANLRYARFLVPAMTNIYNAIVAAGLQGQIRVSTAISTQVIGTNYPPSAGAFRGDVMGLMNPIIGFLRDTRAPLLVNLYTYFNYAGDTNLPLSYGLFTNPSPQFTDPGNNLRYQNLFDTILDGVYSALEKASGSSLEIVVSESGWPSAGGKDASVTNARTYNQNLIQHVRRGSPKRAGRAIENLKNPEFEKNFGLFFPNKQPVYPINFSLNNSRGLLLVHMWKIRNVQTMIADESLLLPLIKRLNAISMDALGYSPQQKKVYYYPE